MKIALVTGASSGLGKAFLEEWAARGVHFDEVWIVARHGDALARVAQALPWQTRIFALDLAVAEERARLFAALAERRPRVAAVVNAAGFGKITPVTEGDSSEQLEMIDLNCTALVDVSQHVLPYLGRGSVIYEIASVAAFLPQPGFAIYAATKAFVLSFSRALNAEVAGRGVRVIAVCPNPMQTAFFERAGGRPNFFKRFFFEDPRAVAQAALDAAEKGRDVVTQSHTAALIRLLAKCFPHRVIIKIEKALM